MRSLFLKSFLIILTCVFTVDSYTAQSDDDMQGPVTTMSFKATEFNFGNIIEGEKIQNVFEFTNTGDEPLIIINAKGSCGCTVPRFPREPIMPGETANLLVQFDSKNKGKVGGALQAKRVTISANTDPVNTYLTIKGTVDKKSKSNEGQIGSDNFDIDADDIILFPNPADQQLSINLEAYQGKSAIIEIYDTKGSLISTDNINEISSKPVIINSGNFDNGLYTASIKIDGKNRIAKQFYVTHGGE